MPHRAFVLLAAVCLTATAAAATRPAQIPAAATAQPVQDRGSLWLALDGPNRAAEVALEVLSEADSHGLRSDDYRLGELSRLRERIVRGEEDGRAQFEGLMTDAILRLFRDLRPQLAEELSGGEAGDELLLLVVREAVVSGHLRDLHESLLPRHPQYAALRRALTDYERAAQHEPAVRLAAGPTLRPGDIGERVDALRARLLAADGGAQAGMPFDAALEAAVMRYQTLHGLDTDGVVGRRTAAHLDMSTRERAARVRLALARWRELPVTLGPQYVHVNIPEYRLELVRNGEPQVQMRVVVGSRDDPTPAFNDSIEYLVFNPYWYVPKRIALEELVPKAIDAPGYLSRQNYDILNDGKLIDESSIDWAAVEASSFDYRIRQRPGPANALGVVKFLFPNPLDIYLHDSPARNLYDRPVRAFSHGCIRLEDAAALAEALLESHGQWGAERIAQTMSAGKRRQINLHDAVPVYLTYITARVTDSGELALFDDIYGRDRRALERYL